MADIDSRGAGVLPALETENAGHPDDDLRVWVSQITGVPLENVRRRWIAQPGKRPSLSTDWIAVGVERIETHGLPLHKGRRGRLEDAESGDVKTVSHQTLHCLASFYGPNALLLADAFREGAQIGQNVSQLAKKGLTVQGVSEDVLHLPDFLLQQWVDRYEVRFKVGRAVTRTYGVRSLASIGEIEIFTEKGKQ